MWCNAERLAEVQKMSAVGYDFYYRIRRRHLWTPLSLRMWAWAKMHMEVCGFAGARQDVCVHTCITIFTRIGLTFKPSKWGRVWLSFTCLRRAVWGLESGNLLRMSSQRHNHTSRKIINISEALRVSMCVRGLSECVLHVRTFSAGTLSSSRWPGCWAACPVMHSCAWFPSGDSASHCDPTPAPQILPQFIQSL